MFINILAYKKFYLKVIFLVKISCYSDIPGWGNFNSIYKELLSTLPLDASILEVGAGFGRGTWAMLDAMADNMSLHVLDSFAIDGLYKHVLRDTCAAQPLTLTPKYFRKLKKTLSTATQKEVFINIISQHPRFSQLKHVYEMHSTDYMSRNNRNIFDLVFLDADHLYESVAQELEYFKDCTLITGHDYNDSWPGVIKAVNDFLETYNDRSLTVFDSEYVFVIKKN